MTDKERIEKTYKKIQTKYPNVSSKEEVDNLAIKMDKRNTLLLSLGYFLGAIVCCIVFFLLVGNETFETTRYLFLVMTGSGIFECFRTFGKYSKIEQRYRPILRVKYEGQLTKDKIIQDGGKILKKADYQFVIAKLPLFDKEDETEVGLDNITYHIHRLYFKIDEYGRTAFIKINRNTYMDATIGAMYYVVLTQQNEIAGAYQASNWDLDPAVLPYCREFEGVNDIKTSSDNSQDTLQQPFYQPAPVVQTTEKEKTKKLLPILAIVLMLVSYFTIILVGVPLGIAALVIAIVALTQQRSKLSIASMVITGILFVFLVFSVIAAFVG